MATGDLTFPRRGAVHRFFFSLENENKHEKHELLNFKSKIYHPGWWCLGWWRSWLARRSHSYRVILRSRVRASLTPFFIMPMRYHIYLIIYTIGASRYSLQKPYTTFKFGPMVACQIQIFCFSSSKMTKLVISHIMVMNGVTKQLFERG